jgi:putative DNA primase/helicase
MLTHYDADINPPHNNSVYGNGVEASSGNQCPCCGGSRWCFILDDGNAAICGKTDSAPNGWVKVGQAKDGRNIFAREGSRRHRHHGLPHSEEILPLALNPKTDSPQWLTLSTVGTESEQQIEYFYPNPETGKPLGKVSRNQWSDRRPAYKDGKTKEVRPQHWAEPAHPDMGDGWWSDRGKGLKNWPLYKEAEVRDAIASGTKVVFLLGGELNVETARKIGLVAFCNQGGEGQYTKQILDFLQENKPLLLCIPHDNDDAGRKFAQKVLNGCRKIEVAAIAIDLRNIYPTLKEKGDITNIIDDAGMDKFEFIQRLEEEIRQTLSVEEAKSKSLNLDQSSNQSGLATDPNCVGNRTVERLVLDNVFARDWITINQSYYRYSGSGYWSRVLDDDVFQKVTNQCKDAFSLVETKHGVKKEFRYFKDSHAKSAFNVCRNQLHQPLNTIHNRHLLAFRNYTVDLRTGEPFPHDPKNFLTTVIAADYEPTQECPEVFLNFLKESYGEDLIDLIRACLSMYLDPTAPFGFFVHLIGDSGSGKGVLLRLIGKFFGLDSYRTGEFANLTTAEGRHQYLSGCSLFAVPDTGGYQQGLRAFYELVDNGAMSGRALFSSIVYQKQWNTRFIVASVNHLNIENSGDGWNRRCIPIPTKLRDGIADPTLETKLEEVKGQIISWALAMPREERDQLLLHPSSNERIVNLKQEAAIYGDPVRAFIDQCLRPTEEATKIHTYELHSKFNVFAQAHGYQTWGEKKFVAHLKTLLPRHRVDQRRKCKGVMIPSHWTNLKFLDNIFVDRNCSNDFAEVSNPNYECIKSMCGEGGLIEFAEFGSPRSPTPNPSLSVGDPAATVDRQEFQENGSPRSPRSPREDDLGEKIENNFPAQLELKNLDPNTPSTPPVGDLSDLGDPKAESIENTLVKTDHPTDHSVIQTKVGDPVKEVAALILQCQTWVAVVTALDAVAAATKREKAVIFDILIKDCFKEKRDRQHFINLLAAHLRQNPQDQAAYNWVPTRYKGLEQKAKVLATQNMP